MFTYHPIRLVFAALLLLAVSGSFNFASAQDKVILVQIDPTVDVDDDDLYDAGNEVARYNLALTQAGPLAAPTQAPAGQTAYRPADCFIPDYKLIYKDFTYVVSTFCTHAMKFKNTAPYTPGPEILRSDFVFSNSSLDKIEKTAKANFTRDFTDHFEKLQTAEENFSSRSSEAANTPSNEEASRIIEGGDFNNPTQETDQAADQVEGQVDADLQNVREEDITDPVTPEQEANEQPGLSDVESRTEEELNRPN